jgi:fatty acid desaturase
MKKEKKQVMLKGIGLHLLVYAAIAVLLSLIGVPGFVVFPVIMVFLWGLFVLSYAYYHHK